MEKILIKANDGFELAATYYAAPEEVALKGQIVLCPGMGIKQDFYKDFASFMASRGLATYLFDYRGMGASKQGSLKGFSATLMDWAEDVQAVAEYARDKNKNFPLFAVTHSVGGQLLGLTAGAKHWDGIVSVASQSGFWKHWSGKYKFRMWLFWYLLLPIIPRIVGFFPAKKMGLFEDIPKGVGLQWAYWGRHPLYMKREFPKAYFEEITCPIKAYSFVDDEEFAPKSGVDWLHQQYENAAVERLHIAPKSIHLNKIGHFNLFRTGMELVFWEAIYSFFEKESNKRLIKL